MVPACRSPADAPRSRPLPAPRTRDDAGDAQHKRVTLPRLSAKVHTALPGSLLQRLHELERHGAATGGAQQVDWQVGEALLREELGDGRHNLRGAGRAPGRDKAPLGVGGGWRGGGGRVAWWQPRNPPSWILVQSGKQFQKGAWEAAGKARLKHGGRGGWSVKR